MLKLLVSTSKDVIWSLKDIAKNVFLHTHIFKFTQLPNAVWMVKPRKEKKFGRLRKRSYLCTTKLNKRWLYFSKTKPPIIKKKSHANDSFSFNIYKAMFMPLVKVLLLSAFWELFVI